MPDRKKVTEYVKKAFDIWVDEYEGTSYFNIDEIKQVKKDALELLKEQREIGHWIDSAGDEKCSVCGATYSDLYPDYHRTHFCPNCGAKMEVEPDA